MAPLAEMNTTAYPLEPLLTTFDSVLSNTTVTPTDKAIYLAGLIITALCLVLDIGILAFVGYKTYRICRRRLHCGGTNDGFGVVADYEEKGYEQEYHDEVVNEKEGEEQQAGLTSDEDDKENFIPLGNGNFGFFPVRPDSLSYMDGKGFTDSVTFPVTLEALLEHEKVIQSFLDAPHTYGMQKVSGWDTLAMI
ncbi:MAG: hypothetical protein Q9213_003699 [Squamulea squamosa]